MLVNGVPRRTIAFTGDGDVEVLDQTRLPHALATVRWRTLADAVSGIRTMQVRGAPLIGVAAAHGLALAMRHAPGDQALRSAAAELVAARPTAVNLAWAVERVAGALASVPATDRAEAGRRLAQALADEDVATCHAIGRAGLPLLADAAAAARRPVQVLTHCNAGWLATVDWGTALAPIYLAHAEGIDVHVWVSETRPRNQGALTAWELAAAGVAHTLVVDNAAGHLLATGQVDLCLVGADRVAANGDVANKVGTALKALAAHAYGVPFYVAAPCSTLDPATPNGASITIEERGGDEVATVRGVDTAGAERAVLVAPGGTPVRNWAFDVTPAALVTALVTDAGVVPADAAGVAQAVAAGRAA